MWTMSGVWTLSGVDECLCLILLLKINESMSRKVIFVALILVATLVPLLFQIRLLQNFVSSDGLLNETQAVSIRKWGCSRNETPFIFVHIGKAGGGTIRARLAASAMHYNRTDWHKPREDTTYYYPVYDEEGRLYPGKFINSDSHNFLPQFKVSGEEKDMTAPFVRSSGFEGIMPCHATTPLGHAIACPQEKHICTRHTNLGNEGRYVDGLRCDTIYVGHNQLGSELHWLPTPFLQQWWSQTTWAKSDLGNQSPDRPTIAELLGNRLKRSEGPFNKLLNTSTLCPDGDLTDKFYLLYYKHCMLPAIEKVDEAASRLIRAAGNNWTQVYSSLPVLRVTMIREPFSWMLSKFFWHAEHIGQSRNDLVWPDRGPDLNRKRAGRSNATNTPFIKCDDIQEFSAGWGRQTSLEYMVYLCGEHCMGQLEAIQKTYGHDNNLLEQHEQEYLTFMEAQSAYNLRNSYAVVGLLQETETFFGMISKRVSYMDTSLNPDVKGGRHKSAGGPEKERCSEVYNDADFRQRVVDSCPEMAAIMR